MNLLCLNYVNAREVYFYLYFVHLIYIKILNSYCKRTWNISAIYSLIQQYFLPDYGGKIVDNTNNNT